MLLKLTSPELETGQVMHDRCPKAYIYHQAAREHSGSESLSAGPAPLRGQFDRRNADEFDMAC